MIGDKVRGHGGNEFRNSPCWGQIVQASFMLVDTTEHELVCLGHRYRIRAD